MSKIEDALRKLQKKAPVVAGDIKSPHAATRRGLGRSIVSNVGTESVEIEGVRHHLDQGRLASAGLLAPSDEWTPVRDEFRRIKRPLIDNSLNRPSDADWNMNLVVVTSALPDAGKTFCAVNLAVSISLERNLSVLLVDGDVAKPHISEAFGLADRPGLIDILENEDTPIESGIVRTDLNELQVLPAGRRHLQSTELLVSDRMAAVVYELATRFADRIIVFDSPPLLAASEAQAVARHAGQILLVVESGKTTEQEIAASLDLLDRNKAINLILNKASYSQVDGYYGGAYSSYGFDDH